MSVGLGADNESAIINGRGLAVAAHARGFPHKSNPIIHYAGNIIRDGWAVELNPTFSGCRETLIGRIHDIFREAKRHLAKGDVLKPVSAARIAKRYLQGAPEDVMISGCDKSWNAYTQTETAPDVDLDKTDIRTFGGHGHISSTVPLPWMRHHQDVFLFIKMVDRYTGLVSTYLLGNETSGVRRQWYGKAGEFRYQNHYGPKSALEYRVWGPEVFTHPVMISLHFGILRHLFMNFDQFAKIYSPQYEQQAREAINKGDSDPALLDLIPPLPTYYTPELLVRARKEFSPLVNQPILSKRWPSAYCGWWWWASKYHKFPF